MLTQLHFLLPLFFNLTLQILQCFSLLLFQILFNGQVPVLVGSHFSVDILHDRGCLPGLVVGLAQVGHGGLAPGFGGDQLLFTENSRIENLVADIFGVIIFHDSLVVDQVDLVIVTEEESLDGRLGASEARFGGSKV